MIPQLEKNSYGILKKSFLRPAGKGAAGPREPGDPAMEAQLCAQQPRPDRTSRQPESARVGTVLGGKNSLTGN